MSKENRGIERTKIYLADRLLAEIVYEKILIAREYLDLYKITKDKYDLCEFKNYNEQVKNLIEARKILKQTLEKELEEE